MREALRGMAMIALIYKAQLAICDLLTTGPGSVAMEAHSGECCADRHRTHYSPSKARLGLVRWSRRHAPDELQRSLGPVAVGEDG